MDSRLVFRPRPCRVITALGDPERQRVRAHWTWRVLALFKGGEERGDHGQSNTRGPGLARKAGCRSGMVRPYRKPTLVGECKYTKVGERTFVKELGNLAP